VHFLVELYAIPFEIYFYDRFYTLTLIITILYKMVACVYRSV